MLVEFRVRNYACFRDEQILSLVAGPDKTLPDNLIQPPGKSKLELLRSAVVYGANASGKTKLLDALMTMCSLVRYSFRREPNTEIGVVPFAFDSESAIEPTQFEITFIQEGVRYQYGFEADSRRVWSEYLYAAPRGRTVLYFRRDLGEEDSGSLHDYTFGASLTGQNVKIREMTRENALFLSTAAALNHPMLASVYGWFSQRVGGVQAPNIRSWAAFAGRLQDEHHAGVRDLLRLADLGISDYMIEQVDYEQDAPPKIADRLGSTKPKQVSITMLHNVEGSDVSLSLLAESHGTQQLFALAPYVLDALTNGMLLVVDELDASLHPLLARALVEMFHDPRVNRCNAQLLFNTHDTPLLDQNLFRRDQIYFTEKDQQGAAHLYPLMDYSPRTNESLAKGYLLGRYGAIPFLGDPAILFPDEGCE
ncbi:MAG: AAA family ATPase [Anaerolineae bacterium]